MMWQSNARTADEIESVKTGCARHLVIATVQAAINRHKN
jgi:hypothetical protein